MTKIYAVSAGSYSDYGVVALFDSQELAELFMKQNPTNRYDGYNDIEEYELNPGAVQMREGFSHYWVQMYEDGSTRDGMPEVSISYLGQAPDAGLRSDMRNGLRFFNWNGWAQTPTHALKSANEHRVRLLAFAPPKLGKSDV